MPAPWFFMAAGGGFMAGVAWVLFFLTVGRRDDLSDGKASSAAAQCLGAVVLFVVGVLIVVGAARDAPVPPPAPPEYGESESYAAPIRRR